MITLNNGKSFEFLMASGMMGFDGKGATLAHKILYKFLEKSGLFDPKLFTIITKTITLPRVEGYKKIKPIKDGWWNNYGLDNPGLIRFLKRYILTIRETDGVVVSVAVDNKNNLEIIANFLNILFPNIIAVEFNVSCPNAKMDFSAKNIISLCHDLFKLSKLPIILKIGADSEYLEIARMTEKIVQAIDINSVGIGNGAYSGKRIQPLNWRILKELVDSTSTPIIGPSVWDYEDIEKLFNLGAKAISFGSVSMIHPARLAKEGKFGPVLPTLWVKKWREEEEVKDMFLKSSARVSGRK